MFVLAACGGNVRGPDRARLSAKEMFEKFKPAIVRIEGAGVGTGFLISKDGRIATNLHVIAGSPKLWVVLSDGSRVQVQRVVAYDAARDLAIIEIDAERKLPKLDLGDSNDVSTGDRVIAIGNPLGVLDYTISDGLISARRQFPGKEVLQISAPISLGSSGGPLFNNYGEVIGVATFIAQEGQNLNFGMPSNYLRPLLDERGGVSVSEFHEEFGQSVALTLKRGPNAPSLGTGGEGEAEGGVEEDPDESGGTSGGGSKHPKVTRKIPQHDPSVLDGCSESSLIEVFRRIGRAIELGAPVYNRGEYEACFVIYRGTAKKIRKLSGMCEGVRDALADGLQRADGLSDPAAQAWAMRDAFDGLLNVIVRKLRGSGARPRPAPI